VVAYSITVKSLEKIHSLLEVIWNLFLGCVASVTGRSQGTNTSSMFSPLVFPERLIIAIDVNPELILHENGISIIVSNSSEIECSRSCGTTKSRVSN
jgi:hypothetical protein